MRSQEGPIPSGASRDDQSSPVVSRILEEVSVDVSGPYPPDRSGNLWFVLFVDRKSRFRYAGLMRNKGDTMPHFLSFCESATRQHPDVSIDDLTAIRMDGGDSGGEFFAICDYTDLHGIRVLPNNDYFRTAHKFIYRTNSKLGVPVGNTLLVGIFFEGSSFPV